MSKDLLYQPQIGYKKSYYTEGEFDDASTQQIKQVPISERPIVPQIDNLIDTIDNNLKWVPVVIKETYLSPYIALKEEYKRVSTIEDPEDTTYEPTVIDSTLPDDDFPPDPFAKGTDVYINIKDPLGKKAKVATYKYKYDFLDVYKDYLEKVSTSIQNYLYSTLAALNLTDKNQDLESYATVDVNNKDLYHLSDYLTKSSISFDQTVRLHKKMFDMDSTILHVRGIRLSEKLIERYYDIEKLDNDNDLAVSSNVILTESKRIADKKYKENFYALYKYLNSSVILMSESTQMLLKQNKSILTINMYEEKEGN